MHNQLNLLQRSTPEREGVSSKAILRFLGAAMEQGIELHSFMFLRHGNVIAEGWWYPYHHSHPHMLFSMTKSFTATGVGFAIAEGLFSLDDDVASFFSEIEAFDSNQYRPIRVRDLLTMSVGHQRPTMGGQLRTLTGSWIAHFLKTPVEHPPGTRFLYNTIASHMLSALIQQTTRLPLSEYLQPRLFTPLGISNPVWDKSPEGHTTGASGLSLKTDDIAKFGQFVLQKGRWNGQQLLPESWVEAATSCQIATGSDEENDSHQGYGYQFWRCRHGAVRADGAFGQLCIISPRQHAVIAITAGVPSSSKILNLVWTHLLPAMHDELLPNDVRSQLKLEERLGSLSLPVPNLPAVSPFEEGISGKVYSFTENVYGIETVSIVFEKDSCLLVLEDNHGLHRLQCGRDHWLEGITRMTGYLLDPNYRPELRVAARVGWRSERELVITLQFVEAPFCNVMYFRFIDNQIQLDCVVNTDQGLTRPSLFGSA